VQRFESLDGYAIESKIKAMLLGLGLKEEALTLPLEKLSGGEKMRVAFARVLLEEPDLLVLDEPTNHLDIEAVE
jgi:ATP-binding cassette subfamily F protein 3